MKARAETAFLIEGSPGSDKLPSPERRQRYSDIAKKLPSCSKAVLVLINCLLLSEGSAILISQRSCLLD